MESILTPLKEMLIISWNEFVGSLLSPASTISVWWFALFPPLVMIATMLGLAYDSTQNIDPKFKNDRSFKGSFHWIFPTKLLKSSSIHQDLRVMVLLMLAYGPLVWLSIPNDANFIMNSISHWLAPSLNMDTSLLLPTQSPLAWDIAYILSLFICLQFGYWVGHCLMHKIPFLWEFHKIHHSAEHLSGSTSFRVHVVDDLFWTACGGISMVIVALSWPSITGFTPSGNSNALAFWLVFIIRGPLAYLFHSHVWISFGLLENVFTSPAMHTLHHSSDPKHFDKNFGATLSIFDTLFGTILKSEKSPPVNLKLGITEDFNWNRASFWQLFYLPFKNAFRRVTSLEKTPPNSGKLAA